MDRRFQLCVTLTLDLWPWNIIQIQSSSTKSYGLDKDFSFVLCDLELGDVTLDHGHATPLGHVQQ